MKINNIRWLKQSLIEEFEQKSIRDLRKYLNQTLNNLDLDLNLKRNKDIQFASCLKELNIINPYNKEFTKEEWTNYLNSIAQNSCKLLNLLDSSDNNYWKATLLELNNKLYLSIKCYKNNSSTKELKFKQIYILNEYINPIYYMKNDYTLTNNSYIKNMKTLYRKYLLQTNDEKSKTKRYLIKQEGTIACDYKEADFRDINNYFLLGILGCFNHSIQQFNKERDNQLNCKFNKIPYTNFIALLPEDYKEDFYSKKWIEPKIETFEYNKYTHLFTLTYRENSFAKKTHYIWLNTISF